MCILLKGWGDESVTEASAEQGLAPEFETLGARSSQGQQDWSVILVLLDGISGRDQREGP